MVTVFLSFLNQIEFHLVNVYVLVNVYGHNMYAHKDSFPFDFETNGIPFGSKSK